MRLFLAGLEEAISLYWDRQALLQEDSDAKGRQEREATVRNKQTNKHEDLQVKKVDDLFSEFRIFIEKGFDDLNPPSELLQVSHTSLTSA